MSVPTPWQQTMAKTNREAALHRFANILSQYKVITKHLGSAGVLSCVPNQVSMD
uniref:Uncharacterized protein n=1 Tax=Anguilla anguilla TaxID=7936 RepID=A0A0E9SIA2_ANGAN